MPEKKRQMQSLSMILARYVALLRDAYACLKRHNRSERKTKILGKEHENKKRTKKLKDKGKRIRREQGKKTRNLKKTKKGIENMQSPSKRHSVQNHPFLATGKNSSTSWPGVGPLRAPVPLFCFYGSLIYLAGAAFSLFCSSIHAWTVKSRALDAYNDLSVCTKHD